MPTTHTRTRTAALAGMLVLTALIVQGGPADAAPMLSVPRGATIAIHGGGFGHGHGMSQYGAQGAAKKGRSAAQILGFYYPGTATGSFSGTANVLITENIGGPTVVVARPGLHVRDLATGKSVATPTSGAAKKATLWRMTGASSGRTQVSYRTSAWHTWRTLKGNGEFSSTGAALTLVLPHGRVTYRGTLRSMAPISKSTHRITVNRVSLEAYVQGVVPREMPSTWLPAALRAQAIAARTYAAYEIVAQRGSTDQRFNLGDSTTWQVYGGKSAEVASTNAATTATAHQVRTYQPKGQARGPAFTQFSSGNGGQLAPGSQPYLVGKADPYDTRSVDPNYAWTVKVSAARVAKLWPSLGRLVGISVTQRDGSGKWGGRVLQMTLVGSAHDVTFGGSGRALSDFAGTLGLKSTYFTFAVAH